MREGAHTLSKQNLIAHHDIRDTREKLKSAWENCFEKIKNKDE